MTRSTLRVGDVRLAEVPDELMTEAATERRQAWLEDQLSDKSKEWLTERAEIVNMLRHNADSDEAADVTGDCGEPGDA